LLNPVRKILSFTMQGEDQPGSILVFHSRLVSALKWIGGSAFSGAIPEAFGPRNCSQCIDSGSNLYFPESHELDRIAMNNRVVIKTTAGRAELDPLLRGTW
jgi:hypothetical protein